MNKLNRHSDNYRELMLLKIDIKLRHAFRHFAFFLKWLAISAFLGVVCGLTGALFHYFIDEATYLFGTYGFLLYFLPVAGLLTVFSYRSLEIYNDEGTNSILRAARAEDSSAFRVTPLIFLSAFLTHLCGGSAGREGAALQIGGSLGSFIARMLNLKKYEQQMLVMCGMSATFCALFGTPLTAAFFAIEVAGVGTVFYAGLLPAVIASFIAKLTALSLGVSAPSFLIAGVQKTNLLLFAKIIILGILCALLSIIFCRVMHTAAALYRKYLKNDYLRIAVGGFIVVILTLLSGSRDYNGSGMTVITAALAGSAVPAAFAIKIIMTAATSGAGYKGGEIIPAMFIGATFGCTAAPFFRSGSRPERGNLSRSLFLRCRQLPGKQHAAQRRILRKRQFSSLRRRLSGQLHAQRLLQPLQRSEIHELETHSCACHPFGEMTALTQPQNHVPGGTLKRPPLLPVQRRARIARKTGAGATLSESLRPLFLHLNAIYFCPYQTNT